MANGAFTSKQAAAYPTGQSVRIPLHVRLADGYETDGAELSHPQPIESWTDHEILNVVEALRALCVCEGEHYTVAVKWSDSQGVIVRVTSGSRSAETDYVPIPFVAVAMFIGHEELPSKGISAHEDVLRFRKAGGATEPQDESTWTLPTFRSV
jgi:hypothetical protein